MVVERGRRAMQRQRPEGCTASMTGRNDVVPPYISQRPTSTRMPDEVARSRNSCSRRLLPAPASPMGTVTRPMPPVAEVQCSASNARSRWRPTNGVSPESAAPSIREQTSDARSTRYGMLPCTCTGCAGSPCTNGATRRRVSGQRKIVSASAAELSRDTTSASAPAMRNADRRHAAHARPPAPHVFRNSGSCPSIVQATTVT